MDLEMLQERARIIRRIRSFFDDRGYLELDTPLLSPDLIPESCLEVFETAHILPNGDRRPLWLIPSPEIWMKKIIARHRVNVYQICKCFRNGESSGFLHSPEFTMLEYYSIGVGYLESLALTEELFGFLLDPGTGDRGSGNRERYSNNISASGLYPDSSNNNPQSLVPSPQSPIFPQSPVPSPLRMSVAEAFALHAGFDLFASVEKRGGLEAEARRLGLEPPASSGTGELYDLIFIHAVEPKLKQNRLVALTDYPAFVPCLAKKNADGKTVERWELYYNGIELANCFSEETDAHEVRAFFESETVAKERRALVKHKVDGDYWKLFEGKPPFPRCSGVAMGLDRLIMGLCGRSAIDGVLPFPM